MSRASFISALLVVLSLAVRAADPIPPSYLVDWTPGVTVGVLGGIPTRTNLIDVTRTPYSADNTGRADASGAIQSAINAAQINDVIYLPSGRYVLSNALYLNKSSITLRGAGETNTIVFSKGSIKVGADPANYLQSKTDVIINGATKGSSALTFSNTPTFKSGDLIMVGAKIPSNDDLQVIGLGTPVYEPKYNALVKGVNGGNVTLAAPLVFDFTNSAFAISLNPTTYKGIGIENLTVTGTNELNGDVSSSAFLVQFGMAANCWMTGCSVIWARNFSLVLTHSSHLTVRRNRIRFAQSSGSNHAGILLGSSYCLIEDNIIADGLQPGIEFNGTAGNAFFANFFTNNLIDIDNHGPHPLMNLFEANVLGEYPVVAGGVTTHYGGGLIFDGYFGSASHQIIFRNAISSSYTPLYLKRWTSYVSIVGNVLGSSRPGVVYNGFSHDINNTANQIIEIGRPNIGNQSYVGSNPPMPWNFPGGRVSADTPNGVFVFTNTQIETNVLWGNFSNVPAWAGSLIFQDSVNTNLYWPQDGIPVNTVGAGTATNIKVSRSITVSNGWRVFFISQLASCYQQLITTNRGTHVITGNYDYYNKAQTWNSGGAQALPSSYLYRAGAPSWWGTNRWPAVQPDNPTLLTRIPAQSRYLGIPTGSAPARPATPRLTPD